MEDGEFYEKWKRGEAKAVCEYCGKEFGHGGGDFFYPDEEWICYECLERLEREEEEEEMSHMEVVG